MHNDDAARDKINLVARRQHPFDISLSHGTREVVNGVIMGDRVIDISTCESDGTWFVGDGGGCDGGDDGEEAPRTAAAACPPMRKLTINDDAIMHRLPLHETYKVHPNSVIVHACPRRHGDPDCQGAWVIACLVDINGCSIPLLQMWSAEYEKTFEQLLYTECNDFLSTHVRAFRYHVAHLRSFVLLIDNIIIKLGIDNHEVVVCDKLSHVSLQCLAAQNKTNQLYVGADQGVVYVLNLKTLNLLHTIALKHSAEAGDTCNMQVWDIQMITDTLYLYYYEDCASGRDQLFVIEDVAAVVDAAAARSFDVYYLFPYNWTITNYMRPYQNRLYISGEGGLHVFDMVTKQFVRYNRSLCTGNWNGANLFAIEEGWLLNVYNDTTIKIVNLNSDPHVRSAHATIESDMPIRRISIQDGCCILHRYNEQTSCLEVCSVPLPLTAAGTIMLEDPGDGAVLSPRGQRNI